MGAAGVLLFVSAAAEWAVWVPATGPRWGRRQSTERYANLPIDQARGPEAVPHSYPTSRGMKYVEGEETAARRP